MLGPALKTTLGVVALAGAAVVLYLGLAAAAPRFDIASFEASGAEAARAAMGSMAPGGKIYVLRRDTGDAPMPGPDFQWKQFESALRKAGVTPTVRTLPLDPLRPLSVPSGDFIELMTHAGRGDVVVSLMGIPNLTDAQREILGDAKGTLVVFCPGRGADFGGIRALFEMKLLKAAVITKAEGKKPTDAFMTVTPDNLQSLPAPPG
jgi:hypothetical protein